MASRPRASKRTFALTLGAALTVATASPAAAAEKRCGLGLHAGARTSCARRGRRCTRSGATQRTSLTEGACGSVADHGQVLRLLPLSRRQQVVHLSRLWQWRAVGSDRHARVSASHRRSSRSKEGGCRALGVDPAATVSELDRVTCASRGVGWRLVPGARLVGVHYSRGNDRFAIGLGLSRHCRRVQGRSTGHVSNGKALDQVLRLWRALT